MFNSERENEIWSQEKRHGIQTLQIKNKKFRLCIIY